MRHNNLALAVLLFVLTSFAFAADNSAYVYVGWWGNGQYYHVGFGGHISAFAVAPDGSVQPVAGSPFSGPGDELFVKGNFLFAAAGQDIVTYTRATDGSLQQIYIFDDFSNTPGESGEVLYELNPDLHGQAFLTVLSCGSCNSTLIPLSIGQDGRLSYLDPTLPGGLGAKISGILYFAPNDEYAYTLGWGGPLSTFRLNQNGMPTYLSSGWLQSPPLSNNQYGGGVCLPGNMAPSVTTGYLAMSWYGDQYWCGNDGYDAATYTVGQNGALVLVPASGFVPQVQENAMAFDPTGTYLALAGSLGSWPHYTGGLQIYKLQPDGTLLAASNLVQVPAIGGFGSVAWDNASHVYAISACDSCSDVSAYGLYIYNFDGQNLTLAPGSPYPIRDAVSLAVAPGP